MSLPPRAPCPFCEIAEGAAADIVYRDEHAIAFLDRRPVFRGHTLVAPLPHVETLGDLPASRLGPFFSVVQRVARGVEAAMGADGSFVAMNNRVSQSVPHLHVHVVPRRRGDGLKGFFWPRVKYASDEDREEIRSAIAALLQPDGG